MYNALFRAPLDAKEAEEGKRKIKKKKETN